ncbi:hypothetical protein O6H91_18G057100 [Diphasiastrum complanatum]|uniref:Uncharacterized protein n=2 Tax=Diphasiastrum complanatum TaxID=34168 RepID=A0ACC2B1K6_DIPCM|nr:hypothetical protein O6H91_18G057100 [Diphasiastrum complanatum]KAJ7523654.1 hypothetical protein O6H91_18G057100 [Diphasiastrum complanatum]
MALSWSVKSFPFTIGVHILGVVAAVLVLVWNIPFRGGLAWSSPNKDLIFNVHPVLIVIGFLFVSSEAILVYKSFPGTKEYKKLVHLTLQGIALILAIVAISAAFKFHNEKGIANLYSLHSWLGLGTVILFGIQWLIGFVTFWYPGAANNTRSALKPWHIFFGLFIYGLALATAESGILEKLTFLQSSSVIGKYGSEAMIANSLGLTLVLLGAFVFAAAVIPVDSPSDAYVPLE